MSKGYVYILRNPSMPGLVKIGKTTRSVQQRCHELWQTGVPTPFEVVDEVYSPNCHDLELWLHDQFTGSRVSKSREFFAVEPVKASRVMRSYLNEQVSALVDEFLPGHVAVTSEMTVSEPDVLILAEGLGAHPFVVVAALGMVTADELKPALQRMHDRVRSIRASTETGEQSGGDQ